MKSIKEIRQKNVKEQEEKKKKEEERKEKFKQSISSRLTKEKEQNEKAQQHKLLLQQFMKRPDVANTMAVYKKQLGYIFKYFARMNAVKIADNSGNQASSMDVSKFAKFCSYFKLTRLLPLEESLVLFRQLAKHSTDSQAIDYCAFEEAVIRIALLVKERLRDNGKVIKAQLNKEYDVEGESGRVVENLLGYMDVRKEDSKRAIEKKLEENRVEAAKVAGKKTLPASIKGTVTNSPRISGDKPSAKNDG